MVGGIGAFTTFSTYSLETFNLLRYGEPFYALMNFLLNNILAFVGVFSGFLLAKMLVGLIKRGL